MGKFGRNSRFNQSLISQVSRETCINNFVWLKFNAGCNFVNFGKLYYFVACINLATCGRKNTEIR